MDNYWYPLFDVNWSETSGTSYMRATLGHNICRIALAINCDGLLYTPAGCFYLKGNLISFTDQFFEGYWIPLTGKQVIYQCNFPAEYLKGRVGIKMLHAINLLNNAIMLIPDQEMTNRVIEIFEKMLNELNSDYIYKTELMQIWLHILVHQLLKIKSNHPIVYHEI